MIVEVHNAEALRSEPFRQLFRDALDREGFPQPEPCREWCEKLAEHPDVGILVHVGDGALNGLAVVDADGGPWGMASWVLLLYGGSPPVTRALAQGVRDWLAARDRFLVRWVNLSGRSDQAYIRLFRQAGFGDGRPVGGVIEFEAKRPDSEARSDTGEAA